MTKEEIRVARQRVQQLINEYAQRHYDARPLLKDFQRLTEEWNKVGGKIKSLPKICTEDYWENPLHYDRQHLNKNPIIDCKDGKPVWKNGRIVKYKEVQSTPREIIKTVEIAPQKSYYSISICWVESQPQEHSDIIDKVKRFFDEMGIERLDDDSWENYQGQTELSLTYMFEGTEDGFKMLKRSVMAMLDIMSDCSFNIGVIGKKLNNIQ